MCCATKNALFSVILWLLTLIGIAPVTTDWVDTVEQWIGYEQALQPAIHIYASAEAIDLRSFVFATGEVDAAHPQPAVVTAFRANPSQSMPSAVLSICSDLARMGYVAIAFEMPPDHEDGFGLDEDSDPLLAAVWLAEHSDDLGVDLSHTTAIAIFGQPVLGLQLDWDLNSQENAVEHEVILIPEGAERFPSELVQLLPSLL
jgi:hypothetical protein